MTTTTHRSAARAHRQEHPQDMSRRETLEALSGLLLALFVGLLSSTIVSNALPTITSRLHGSETQYTWVVTASLLAATATTPIWGKLADLFSKKLLVQSAIIVFIVGSALCGLSRSMGALIGFRVIQGVGMGGLQALAQVVIGAMIPPRERGKYSGYLGAVMAVATVGGPLLGGVIVDTSWLGWRWCFYVGVPIAAVALVLLQKTLHLPTFKRDVSIDWLGATLVALGVSLLLVWVSFAGTRYDWVSWQSGALAGGGVLALLLAVLVEAKVREPMIPLAIVRERTTALAIVASLAVGIAMFGASVFFGQYFQISRGWSPTKAGLATTPMIIALLVASTVAGQVITRTGRWKRFLVAGSLLLVAGLGLLGTIDHSTSYGLMSAYMALVGLGVGMTMQNLVLAVQNTVDVRSIGAASSVVTFFRSMGGAVGVSVLGSIAATRISDRVSSGLAAMGVRNPSSGGSESLDLTALPAPVARLVRAVYGDVIGDVFVITAVVAVVTVLAVVFIREVPLRTSNALPSEGGAGDDGGEQEQAAATGTAAQAPQTAVAVSAPVGTQQSEPVREEQAHAPHRQVDEGHPSPGTPVPQVAHVYGDSSAGRLVHGRVRRSDGQALPGASITLADLGGRQVGRTRSGDDGSYRLRPPAGGTYLLVASAPPLAPAASMVAVGDAPVVHDVTLAGDTCVHGLVRGAHRAPVAGALVTVTSVQGEVVATAATGRDGRYELRDLLAGTCTLAVQAAGHQPVALTLELTAGQVLHRDVELLGAGRLGGVVRAATDGRPLAEATVTLLDGAGTVLGNARTGVDGAYAFDDLLEGTYTLIASGYAPIATSVRVSPGAEVLQHVSLGDAA